MVWTCLEERQPLCWQASAELESWNKRERKNKDQMGRLREGRHARERCTTKRWRGEERFTPATLTRSGIKPEEKVVLEVDVRNAPVFLKEWFKSNCKAVESNITFMKVVLEVDVRNAPVFLKEWFESNCKAVESNITFMSCTLFWRILFQVSKVKKEDLNI